MNVVCKNCGHQGSPERKLKGHFLITLILLLCYIIPGIIYIIWRRSGVRDTCRQCGSSDIVDTSTAMGRAVMHNMPTPETHVKCPDCRELIRKDAVKCRHCSCTLIPSV